MQEASLTRLLAEPRLSLAQASSPRSGPGSRVRESDDGEPIAEPATRDQAKSRDAPLTSSCCTPRGDRGSVSRCPNEARRTAVDSPNADRLAPATGRLSVLTTAGNKKLVRVSRLAESALDRREGDGPDTEAPVGAETAVVADLLEALEVLTHLHSESERGQVSVVVHGLGLVVVVVASPHEPARPRLEPPRRDGFALRPQHASKAPQRSREQRTFESSWLDSRWPYLPSTMSFCLLTNQLGILNWPGFCMIVTMRSSSSGLSSPALVCVGTDERRGDAIMGGRGTVRDSQRVRHRCRRGGVGREVAAKRCRQEWCRTGRARVRGKQGQRPFACRSLRPPSRARRASE